MQDPSNVFCKCLWVRVLTSIGISPIFNIADLYPYTTNDAGQSEEGGDPIELEEVN